MTQETSDGIPLRFKGIVLYRVVDPAAAAMLFDRTHGDLVRIGISMYGLWSSRETMVSYRERRKQPIELRPALTWKTRIAQLSWVPEDAFIGYGCTYKTTHASRIAVIPVGYFDGFDRHLSGNGYVLLRGKRAPIRGRICMNFFMVDVTHIPGARPGDEVVLIGEQGAAGEGQMQHPLLLVGVERVLDQVEACIAGRQFSLEVLATATLLGASIERLEPGVQFF